MKLFFTLFFVCGLFITGANAHSTLRTSYPSDKAILKEAPEKIVLEFASDIRLTKLVLNHGVTETKLPLETKGFAKVYTVDINVKAVGHYKVSWRGLSKDGHIVSGRFSYNVNP